MSLSQTTTTDEESRSGSPVPSLSSLNVDLRHESKADEPACLTRSGTQSSCSSVSPTSLDRPFIIGVCGGTASGKSTVCHMLEQFLKEEGVTFVPSDAFYKVLTPEQKQRAHNSDYDFDSPDALDMDLLYDVVTDLRNWKSSSIPVYDFGTHSRKIGEQVIVKKSAVIIVEGILIFSDKRLRDLMDLKVFVDADSDTRLARRVARDIAERGRDVQSVLDQYARFVKPSYEKWVEPGKRVSDIIIPNIGEAINSVAVDMMLQTIRFNLQNRKPKIDLCIELDEVEKEE